MSDLERMVWAAVYAKHFDTKGCWSRAWEEAKADRLSGSELWDAAEKEAECKEAGMTADAAEFADLAVIRLRRHIEQNQDEPGTPHVILHRDPDLDETRPDGTGQDSQGGE